MKWKISRLDIKGFKAFDQSIFDFEKAGLVTLDGPNGYGKTTVFDAVELLLTKKIDRVCRLFETVMSKKKTNYSDNLYWNIKRGQKDLCIKAEFFNDENDQKLVIARMARVADLRRQNKNRADNFEAFKLYSLNSFESVDFNSEKDEKYLNEIFGRNFTGNFSLLNYLEQGQNTFLFSNSTEKRKAALSELVDSQWLLSHIKKCQKWEQRIQATHLSPLQEKAERDLSDRIARYMQQLGGQEFGETFSKITSVDVSPAWDLASPFSEADINVYNMFIQEISALKETSERKQEVKIRLKNISIEKYISKNRHLFEELVKFGKHITSYSGLKNENSQIVSLRQLATIFSKSPAEISGVEAGDLVSRGLVESSIVSKITLRDEIKKKTSEKSIAVTELNRLKTEIVDKFTSLRKLESTCPLCGHDWEAQQSLLSAIERQQNNEAKELGDIGAQYDAILVAIKDLLAIPALANNNEYHRISNSFPSSLFENLKRSEEHFESLNAINDRLQELNIDYGGDYTEDSSEINRRVENLLDAIRQRKEVESEGLPQDWQSIIERSFKTPEDFYIIDSHQVYQKLLYVNFKYSEFRISTLKQLQNDFAKMQKERAAAIQLKEKIINLRTQLTKLERDYSSNVLSDIELTFHIYSGRLIQNYQRGLGLFIEHGEGKEIRFSTAELSEHDALLSMSSGQIAALSLAFFFSLNKVYSKSSMILIDDPAQSLDEINIASLSDLLRSELKNRQILISSHEDEISAYMRYRFARAGLSQKGIHMQRHSRTAEQ